MCADAYIVTGSESLFFSRVSLLCYSEASEAVPAPPVRWPNQHSPSPFLPPPQLSAATAGKPSIGSVDVRRAQLPPLSEVVILTEMDSAQTYLRPVAPQPATAWRDVEPRKRSAGSSPIGQPAANQRAPATGLEDHPSNAARITPVEEAFPNDSEFGEEQLPGAEGQGGGEGDRQLWPGSDFKLEQYLADSVYLWACGEHRKEGGVTASRVSRSEAAAAWVVLLVSTE